jgi:hypothetical protein
LNEEEDEAYFVDQEYSGLYDEDVWECIECYLILHDTPHTNENPLNYAHICELQQQDEQLLALQVKYPDSYVNLQLDEDIDVITCYKKDPTQPNWKIALPESMVVDTVKWFHQVMGHPGEKRLQETLNQHYYHPQLRYHIDKLKCKDKTDRPKRAHFSFGEKLLTDKKLPQFFQRSIFNPTHHSLSFCVLFLAVGTDLVGKCCGRKLGGQFGQFIAKSPL